QAEDGIRDRNVTGVQTCALPILLRDVVRVVTGAVQVHLHGMIADPKSVSVRHDLTERAATVVLAGDQEHRRGDAVDVGDGVPLRSEERRVGKGWRYRVRPEPCNE